ncbi:MAG: MATE family efflux transporter [Oscillospiraceae bacterium]|jgi:putative MATE family efflux protein|nr:MATE family efflux transporter [Oscillospiraceae bacterium]
MKNNLTDGSVWKVLIRFTIPFLLSGVFQVLYGTVDIYFLGHFGSGASISGAASASQAMGMVTMAFMGLTLGGTVIIGHSVGAKDDETSAKATGNMVLIFAGIAVLCTCILALGSDAINRAMQVPDEALGEARSYMLICGIGSTFIMGYNVVSAILRGLGNSKAPLYFVGISCIINIALDYVFVALLHMNAAGAAIATVISQGLSLIIALLYIRRVKLPYPFGTRHLAPDRNIIRRILKIGIPSALQQLLVSFSFSLITAITNTMGIAASAGAGVVGKAVDLCMMIPASFSNSITSVTAQNVGAGKPERALKSMWYGTVFSLVFAIPYTLLGSLKPEWIIGLLSDEAAVIEQGARYLIPFSWDCILVSFVFCMNGYFNGLGKSIFTMAHNISTTFLVRIPIVWLMSRRIAGATLFEVGLGTPAATFVSLVICFAYLGIMKRKSVEAHKTSENLLSGG